MEHEHAVPPFLVQSVEFVFVHELDLSRGEKRLRHPEGVDEVCRVVEGEADGELHEAARPSSDADPVRLVVVHEHAVVEEALLFE